MPTFYVVTKTTYGKTVPLFINADDAALAKQDAASSKVTKKVLSVERVTKRTLTPAQLRHLLFIARGDAEEILQHVADAMLSAGMTKEAALPSLRTATKRLLQLAASGINLAVTAKLMDAEAGLLAEKIIDSVTVIAPELVPPVRERRGLPAAVAAVAARAA
jgi:hypothetical protein